MPLTINFAYQLTKKRSKEIQKDKALFAKAIVVGGIAVVVVVISLVARVSTDLIYANAEKNEKQVLGQLESLKPQEMAYLGYISKVNILSELFQNRQAKQQALRKFRTLFGPGVFITGLNYSETSDSLEFQVKTGTVFQLEQVIAQLDDPALRSEYSNIVKRSLNRDESANYSLWVSVNLRPVAEEAPKATTDQDPSAIEATSETNEVL